MKRWSLGLVGLCLTTPALAQAPATPSAAEAAPSGDAPPASQAPTAPEGPEQTTDPAADVATPEGAPANRRDAATTAAPTEASAQVDAAPKGTPAQAPAPAAAPRLAPMAETPAPSPAPPQDQPPEPPPGPVTQHVQVAFTVDTVIVTDESFEIFRDDNAATKPGVAVGYAFWLDDRLSIQPEVGYENLTASSSGLLGGALSESELDEHTIYAGVSARYELWGFFAPHVRLSAGASRVDTRLSFARDTTAFESGSWLPHGSLGAGASVTTRDGLFRTRALSSVALGVSIEGGYFLGAPLDVTLTDPDADGRLTIASPDLGSLSRSGPYVRGSVLVRF